MGQDTRGEYRRVLESVGPRELVQCQPTTSAAIPMGMLPIVGAWRPVLRGERRLALTRRKQAAVDRALEAYSNCEIGWGVRPLG